ncbi:ATP-binding cassette sub-family A member 7-like [Ostrinia furnacalis]|uniref:ATP-binding cassette sub-family A member 7-like n=1 Tax=Ostrinia furnacalis TaxID=93504 RepID=UPI00103974D2|nr:ATP-binding cassette sub-family A member 7-like [Ostrinia furnacalis]
MATVHSYQHVADAGISALVVLAYSLASAGAAVYLVRARTRQEKRLQLLAGVPPLRYWAAALAWDMLIIVINMVITAILMEAFHFPVFVEKNNLPAICLLILLYG